ncbi:lipoprotein [Undibacterium griseum]|uniref:Lipoprotein n=1 Tax=Undibacterium griseum TaxID=2762295 RepID=A0ABR6YRJ3_9BURK|nr:hypothetical protein [Undibacterium griseum]MBC3886390.1 hypothetical protein [Undibacterium griseum]
MKTISFSMMLVAASVLLSGCGERDQATTTKRGLVDEKAWNGAHNEFVAKGWNKGDKTSWENQVRARGQYQNEYVKTN